VTVVTVMFSRLSIVDVDYCHKHYSCSALKLLRGKASCPLTNSLQHPLLSRGQPANPGSPGKLLLKWCVYWVVVFQIFNAEGKFPERLATSLDHSGSMGTCT